MAKRRSKRQRVEAAWERFIRQAHVQHHVAGDRVARGYLMCAFFEGAWAGRRIERTAAKERE